MRRVLALATAVSGEITVLAGWAGDYYGIPVQSTLDAIWLTGSLEGVIIDPVYEGKSMAALIDLVSFGSALREFGDVLPGAPRLEQELTRFGSAKPGFPSLGDEGHKVPRARD